VGTAKCAAQAGASADTSIGVTADGEVSHDAWLPRVAEKGTSLI
jgi:hypothetical protein